MKITFQENNLFIAPETEFEENVLTHFHNPKAVLKCGISLEDIQCISISSTMNKEEKLNEPVKLIIELINGFKTWRFYDVSQKTINSLEEDFIKHFHELVDPKSLPIGSIFYYNIS